MKLEVKIRKVRDKKIVQSDFFGASRYECPSCHARVYGEDRYCHRCGQPFSKNQLDIRPDEYESAYLIVSEKYYL